MPQQVEEKPKKRKKSEKKLEFEAGKVFTPGEVKEEDFELDLESSKYRAQKGEGGDRRAKAFLSISPGTFLRFRGLVKPNAFDRVSVWVRRSRSLPRPPRFLGNRVARISECDCDLDRGTSGNSISRARDSGPECPPTWRR